jgi:hypothetical protein
MALALVLMALAPASAESAGARAELAMPFGNPAPGRQSGLKLDLRYLDAEDADAKPPTVSELLLRLPDGTRIDTTAVPACQASDAEIQLLGRDACPPESLIGTGTLEVYLGAPGDPQTTDLALFNAPGQILEVLLFEGSNVTVALEHLFVKDGSIRARPAQVPPGAPPESRVAASHIVWDVPARGGYLTTPPTCPRSGKWRTEGEFAFADGSTAKAGGTQACPRAKHRARRPHRHCRVRSKRAAPRGRRGCARGRTRRPAGRPSHR